MIKEEVKREGETFQSQNTSQIYHSCSFSPSNIWLLGKNGHSNHPRHEEKNTVVMLFIGETRSIKTMIDMYSTVVQLVYIQSERGTGNKNLTDNNHVLHSFQYHQLVKILFSKVMYRKVKVKFAQLCPAEFSRPENQSVQPLPSPGDLPNPGKNRHTFYIAFRNSSNFLNNQHLLSHLTVILLCLFCPIILYLRFPPKLPYDAF